MSEINQSKSKGRGGARKGAGRKAGATTKRSQEIAARSFEDGISPLEYMLEVMRKKISDEMEPESMWKAMAMKFEAAKAAAPYMHPRLAAIEHTGSGGGDIGVSFRWAE